MKITAIINCKVMRIFITLLFLVFCTESFSQNIQKEVVVKHVVAGFEQKTLDHYGGLEKCTKLLYEQFKKVDSRMNDADRLDFNVLSVIDTVFVFRGDMDSLVWVKMDRPYDIRILYDGFPKDGGGWWGAPYFTITHKWPVSRNDGPFADYATDGIVHEYCHTMQMYDIYAIEVRGDKNAVNGKPYSPINSIMNNCYGNCFFDDLTVFVMNNNRYGQKPSSVPVSTYFPSEMGLRVVDSTGRGVGYAKVSLYAGGWYKYTIDAPAKFAFSTDKSGNYLFAENPFVKAYEIRYPVFLVEVEVGFVKYYEWLPLTEVQLFYVQNPGKPYRKTITI